VAARYGVHERTIDNWRRRYALPAKSFGGLVRFSVVALEAWEETGGVERQQAAHRRVRALVKERQDRRDERRRAEARHTERQLDRRPEDQPPDTQDE